MLAPGTGKTQTAQLWTYVRDERPWAGPAPPAALYRFSEDRKGSRPAKHLAGFKGWMHADGYEDFEDLYRGGDIREVACLAHVWRKFVDVYRSQGSAIAEEAIARIADLYAVEKTVRSAPPEERVQVRQEHAAPAFDALGLARRAAAHPARKDPARGSHPLRAEPPAAAQAIPDRRRHRDRQQRGRARHARLRPGQDELALRLLRHRRQGPRHRRHARPHPRLQDHPRRRTHAPELRQVAVRPDAYEASAISRT